MQLRQVDPRILIPNPNNPRRAAVPAPYDKQLIANIRETGGPIQPPVVRAQPEGGLIIVAGHRRVVASIAAGLDSIAVFVRDADAGGDSMAAFSENMVRTAMSSVDVWRATEAFIGEGYTEEAVSTALSIPVRTIRRLRLFASILPAMLDRIGQGDEPNEQQLRVIASASRDDQAAAWKKLKPKKTERANWFSLEQALRRQRIGAAVARFDDAHAQAFGIVWTDDLFAEGDKDPRFTDQVELFLAAQQAWLESHLPPNGEILPLSHCGAPQLPPKAQRYYGRDRKARGVRIGLCVNPHTGEVEEELFQMPETARRGQPDEDDAPVRPVRPDISKSGHELIGQYRTEALHQALAEAPIPDGDLIGLLVLALAGDNVRVEQDPRMYRSGSRRGGIACTLTEGGVMTRDMDLLRTAARDILREVLSCEVGMSSSGVFGRIAAVSIDADGWLPGMAHDDFLTKLSKNGITEALRGLNLLPRNTGKEMRAALKQQVGQGRWVHPAALFALTSEEQGTLAKHCREDDTAKTRGSRHPDDTDLDDDPGGDEGLDREPDDEVYRDAGEITQAA